MSFQTYLDNIQAKTGQNLVDFKALAEENGFLHQRVLIEGVKATFIVEWLKADFDLGHGHCMALFAAFKGKTK